MFKKSSNIFTSVIPLLVYLKVVGMFVPSFRVDGSFRIKFIDKIYFSTVYIVMIALLILKLLKPDNEMSSSTIIILGAEMVSNLGVVSSLVMMIYQYRKSEKFIKIVKILHSFDEKVI